MAGLPSQLFVSKFKAKAGKFVGGEELCRKLQQKVGSLDFILIFLELYCGAKVFSPTRESIKEYVSRRKSLAKRLAKFAKRLTQVAAKVECANHEPEVTQRLAQHGRQLFGLPDEIRSYISHLTTTSRQLHDPSLRTAPMDSLHQLAEFVKDGNGEVNYEDLALLLEMGYAAFGAKEVVTADRVKRLLKGARKRNVKQVKQHPVKPVSPPGLRGL